MKIGLEFSLRAVLAGLPGQPLGEAKSEFEFDPYFFQRRHLVACAGLGMLGQVRKILRAEKTRGRAEDAA